MKVSEIPSSQTIAEALIQGYGAKPLSYSSSSNVKLKHDLDLQKLDESIQQSLSKFGRHPWRTSETPTMRYTGFSINYNPHHQESPDPNASSLGTAKNSPKDFFYNQIAAHKEVKNSYFDAYAFTERTPASREGYLNEILNTTERTLIRGRMMILDGKLFTEGVIKDHLNANPGDSRYGWHRDEPVIVNLRINIPITGDENFVFEMINEKPYFLEPGYAYSWDTNQPHRVYCRGVTKLERANLIIGVSPWFDFHAEKNEWLPNQYFNKIHPFDMLKEGLIFPWLKQT